MVGLTLSVHFIYRDSRSFHLVLDISIKVPRLVSFLFDPVPLIVANGYSGLVSIYRDNSGSAGSALFSYSYRRSVFIPISRRVKIIRIVIYRIIHSS